MLWKHDVYVAELGNMKGVLGGDFLSTGAKIDFGLGILKYNGQEINLLQRSLANVASVRAISSFIIKAKTIAKFPVEVVVNEVGFMRLNSELLLEVVPSFGDTRTVGVPEPLVKPDPVKGLVPMVIANPLDKDLYIWKGTWLASVSPVKTVGPLQALDEESPLMSASESCEDSPLSNSSESTLAPHLRPLFDFV